LIPEQLATAFIAITCITGPILGALIGGLTLMYYGGYNNKKSQAIVLLVSWLGVVVAIPIPFVSGMYSFGIFTWTLFFCGGFIFPAFAGMMLSTVPYKLRGSANSLAQFSYNCFGYMPAPFIYGLISETVDPKSKYQRRFPLASVVYVSAISITLASIVIRRINRKNLQKNWMQSAE